MQILQETFGEPTSAWGEFKNCRVRHKQDPATKYVTLDQNRVVATLETIVHPHLATESADSNACPVLHELCTWGEAHAGAAGRRGKGVCARGVVAGRCKHGQMVAGLRPTRSGCCLGRHEGWVGVGEGRRRAGRCVCVCV